MKSYTCLVLGIAVDCIWILEEEEEEGEEEGEEGGGGEEEEEEPPPRLTNKRDADYLCVNYGKKTE